MGQDLKCRDSLNNCRGIMMWLPGRTVNMDHISGQPTVKHRGGVGLPTLFNVSVDSVVHHWPLLTAEDDVIIQSGLGHAVVQSLGFF